MKFIGYLSNGYPDMEQSVQLAEIYAKAGCDIIEVDLPSRDPFLEGEYIANRMAAVLKSCDDYKKYMDNIIEMKRRLPNTNFLIVVYENTVKEIGVQRFIDFCLTNQLNDVIFVGLDNEDIKNQLIEQGLRISCYVQFHMDPAEIEFAKASNGFVYLQAKTAPENINPQFPNLASCVEQLREQGITRPIYCGVGVSSPDDFKMVKNAKADGAFVGSTILKLYDQPEKLMKTIKSFKRVDLSEYQQ